MEKSLTVAGGTLMGVALLSMLLPVWMMLLGGGGLVYAGTKLGSTDK